MRAGNPTVWRQRGLVDCETPFPWGLRSHTLARQKKAVQQVGKLPSVSICTGDGVAPPPPLFRLSCLWVATGSFRLYEDSLIVWKYLKIQKMHRGPSCKTKSVDLLDKKGNNFCYYSYNVNLRSGEIPWCSCSTAGLVDPCRLHASSSRERTFWVVCVSPGTSVPFQNTRSKIWANMQNPGHSSDLEPFPD